MNDLGCLQHSPEWYAARLGMLTASKITAAITKRKRGDGDLAARKRLKLTLLAEMATDLTPDNYVSPAMEWGIENEPRARAEYEIRTGSSVEPVGLLLHPEYKWAAASPDGYIAPNGLLEIKCPDTATHFEYLEGGVVPEEYRDQIDWQMACAGPEIEWTDFVSFDPRVKKDDLKIFIVRRQRDDQVIAEKEKLAVEFMDEMTQLFEQIKRGAKGQTLESKLRESIRLAQGKYQTDAELKRELASLETPFVP